MGCGCGKGKGSSAPVYHEIVHQDGTVRRYLTSMEAEAAARASQSTSNPASVRSPQPA